jgi:ubiquinone/menaquinone biosynthesis C-methylase UbiE
VPAQPPRRRSRRTVKTEDDIASQLGADVAKAPETQETPAAPGVAPVQATPPAGQVTSSVQESPLPGEVIMPMRIIAIGDDLPPVAVRPSDKPPPPQKTAPETAAKSSAPGTPASNEPSTKPVPRDDLVEEGWTPRPAEVANITAAFAAESAAALPPPAPVAPPVEAPIDISPSPLPLVEAKAPVAPVVEDKPIAPKTPTTQESPELEVEDVEVEPVSETRTDEIEHIEEIEPERVSDVGDKSVETTPTAAAAATPAAAPKKPPPPPPPARRAESVSLPGPPPPPPKQRESTAPSRPPASMPEPSRRRQRPWWEDLFDDDFIRTMDKLDPKNVQREADFIETCLGLEKGATILDLACGTGQHAVELASRGYGVVGYDLSLSMLALAADVAQERGQKLNFLQGDMREMAFDQVFDGLYCWSTNFGYFDDDKNFNVLQRMHRALRLGGMLVLDMINRDYVAPRQPSLVWFEGDGCVCMDEMQVDFFTSRLKVKRTAMFDDGRSREIDYSIRLYGLHEIGKMMHDANFKVIEVTGHPAHPGVFFGSESPRLIIVAERK